MDEPELKNPIEFGGNRKMKMADLNYLVKTRGKSLPSIHQKCEIRCTTNGRHQQFEIKKKKCVLILNVEIYNKK